MSTCFRMLIQLPWFCSLADIVLTWLYILSNISYFSMALTPHLTCCISPNSIWWNTFIYLLAMWLFSLFWRIHQSCAHFPLGCPSLFLTDTWNFIDPAFTLCNSYLCSKYLILWYFFVYLWLLFLFIGCLVP